MNFATLLKRLTRPRFYTTFSTRYGLRYHKLPLRKYFHRISENELQKANCRDFHKDQCFICNYPKFQKCIQHFLKGEI